MLVVVTNIGTNDYFDYILLLICTPVLENLKNLYAGRDSLLAFRATSPIDPRSFEPLRVRVRSTVNLGSKFHWGKSFKVSKL